VVQRSFATGVVLGVAAILSCGGDKPGGARANVCSVEPADEAALLGLASWTDLPTFHAGTHLHVTSTDRGGISFPPQAPDNRDYNNFVCQGRIAGAIDPSLSFDTPTCPESYVKGFVGARVEGSGRLARLWATGVDTTSGAPLEDAIVRIYVDDEPDPCIELTIADAKRPPPTMDIFAVPFGENTDNDLAWYYPVVFSKKLIFSIDNIPHNLTWYQADFVVDEQPTRHERAGERLPARDEAKTLLASVGAPVPQATPLLPDTAVALPTDLPVTVASLTGPSVVHSLRVRVADAAVAALNQIDVAVTWDGEPSPAIAMTLGDLFATSLGMADTPTSSLSLGISKANGQTTLDLRLPMPFAAKAVVVLDNHAAAATVNVAIDGLASLPPEPWGYLTAVRSETVGPTTSAYHPMVTASGQGRLVGACLMAQGHSSPLLPDFIRGPLNFLEGDEQMKIDGQTLRGTGTEDYFDSGFYFNPAAAGFPFAQWGGKVEDVANNTGKMSACRWHVLGTAIDFHQSLDVSMEVGPPDPASLDRYVTTTFLYRSRGI
jgi:hypothetical protein